MANKLTNFEIKSFKLFIKLKTLIFLLQKAPFILFVYFDFFNASERLLIRQFLNKYDLQTLLIKKNEIKQLRHIINDKNFYNMLLGNILFIYNKNLQLIDKDVLKILINHPKFHLIGGKWHNKIYRASQIKKLLKFDDLTLKKSVIKELLYLTYCLRNILSRIH